MENIDIIKLIFATLTFMFGVLAHAMGLYTASSEGLSETRRGMFLSITQRLATLTILCGGFVMILLAVEVSL